jgi:hypothetical protein
METPIARLDRRTMIRLLGAGALAFASMPLLSGEEAAAGITWCRADPVLTVNGKTYHIYACGPQELLTASTGPIRLKVTVGGNVRVRLSDPDQGFGDGWSFSLSVTSGLKTLPGPYYELKASVYVPAAGDYPIRVETQDMQTGAWSFADGRTNSTVYATGLA